MARTEPKNPFVWYLAQIVEYIVVLGVFLLNYLVVVPRIGGSSRSEDGER